MSEFTSELDTDVPLVAEILLIVPVVMILVGFAILFLCVMVITFFLQLFHEVQEEFLTRKKL